MKDENPKWWRQVQRTHINRKSMNKQVRRAEDVTVRHARKFILRRWSNVREVRRAILLWIITIGVLIGATGLQVMWNQQGYRTVAVGRGGTYAEAVLGPINTLNPLFAESHAEEAASRLLFSSLFTYDKSGFLAGDLATQISVDSTNKIYTVKIRPDSVWQDGYKLTASDVAFTINLLKNPAVRSTNPEDWRGITVKAIDPTTLVFTLPAVIAAFPYALTFPIVPEHVLSKIEPNAIRENAFSNAPIGSGPFKLRLLQDVDAPNGLRIVHLERNSYYYKGASRLELLQLNAYETSEQILRALDTGEVSAAADLSSTDILSVDENRYQVKTTPIKSGVYALFNTTKGVLQDKTIRKALQLGTNTAAIRQQLSAGTQAIELPFTNGQLTGDVPKAPALDVNLANKTLEDAGWKLTGSVRTKDGAPLRISVVAIKDSDYERVLEMLAGQWRTLGLQVDTLVIDPGQATQTSAQDTLRSRNYDVLIYQLTIGVDPDVYAYWHSSQANPLGYNLANYSSPIADDALVSARTRLEPALRNSKYLTFSRQWLADAPAIGLYQSMAHYVYSDKNQAYADDNVFVSQFDRYSDVLYWSVGSRKVYKTP